MVICAIRKSPRSGTVAGVVFFGGVLALMFEFIIFLTLGQGDGGKCPACGHIINLED